MRPLSVPSASAPVETDLTAPLIPWYEAHARDLPWRRADFHQSYGPWGTLVSEYMLQQTPVARVIAPLRAWLERWPTAQALARESPAEVLRQWDNLGYPRRALWLQRAAQEITDRHGGEVPRDIPALLALPGVGDYTARAVAVFAFGDRHPVVDTNTRRVLARVRGGRAQPAAASPRDLAEMAALLPAPRTEAAVVNAAMMELGATVCTARSPNCPVCPLRASCQWWAAGRPDTGDARRRAARYEGSDRQVRGAILRMLRAAPEGSLAREVIETASSDLAQATRAIDSLLSDGLIAHHEGSVSLPRTAPQTC